MMMSSIHFFCYPTSLFSLSSNSLNLLRKDALFPIIIESPNQVYAVLACNIISQNNPFDQSQVPQSTLKSIVCICIPRSKSARFHRWKNKTKHCVLTVHPKEDQQKGHTFFGWNWLKCDDWSRLKHDGLSRLKCDGLSHVTSEKEMHVFGLNWLKPAWAVA